jgi:tRNA (guanine37-N1)-methyltransferase
VEINVHDIREFATDKHKMTDDRPFGGRRRDGVKAEPIFAAIEHLLGTSERERYPTGTSRVLLSPQGAPVEAAVGGKGSRTRPNG